MRPNPWISSVKVFKSSKYVLVHLGIRWQYHIVTLSTTSQVHEVFMLVNQLIPPVATDVEDIQLVLAKEQILVDQPNFLHEFSMEFLPASIQVYFVGRGQYYLNDITFIPLHLLCRLSILAQIHMFVTVVFQPFKTLFISAHLTCFWNFLRI